MFNFRKFFIIVGIVALVVMSLIVFNSNNADAKQAGELCSVSQAGNGDVYISFYNNKLVCESRGYYVGNGASEYEWWKEYVFPSPPPVPTVCQDCTPTPLPTATPDPCDGYDKDNDQWGHSHPGGGTNSLTQMTNYQACGHGIYHLRVWSDKKPKVHYHFSGQVSDGFSHSH